MFKKLVAHTILLSMVLHCGFRLELIDHLYQQRHDIALALGLVSEKPIAMCSSNYSSDGSLKIEAGENSPSVPHSVIQVKEINLFFVSGLQFKNSLPEENNSKAFISLPDCYKLILQKSVFHPPCAS